MVQQDNSDQLRHEALRTEYSEVLNTFRTLTDIRFKLLAFLPIAAAVAAALNKESPNIVGLALPLFGLVATIGLATYNARNDQLYNELVGRAAAIERSLGIPDGAFANRPRPWLHITLLGRKRKILEPCIRLLNKMLKKEWKVPEWKIPEWKIDHGTAVSTIYVASIALWVFALVAYMLEWCRRIYLAVGLPSMPVKEPSAWVNFIAIVIAIVVTYLGSRSISKQKEARSEEMRVSAEMAMKRAVDLSLHQLAKVSHQLDQQEFIEICARDDNFVNECAKLLDDTKNKVRARAEFYASLDSDYLKYYIPQGPRDLTACHLIALMTDLPPLWIHDRWSNRKGSRKIGQS